MIPRNFRNENEGKKMRGRNDMAVCEHLNRPPGRQRRRDGVISPENGRPNERRHISLGTIAKIGGFVAAPFTGGASIPVGLGVGGAFDAASQQGKANKASEEALEAARRDMAARQPFRDQLFSSLQNPAQRQDLGNLFQSQNPFAQNLGPLNPSQPQATAPIGGGSGLFGGLGGVVQRFLDEKGLAGLSREELRQRGVTGAFVDRRGGFARKRVSAPVVEDEARRGGGRPGEDFSPS